MKQIIFFIVAIFILSCVFATDEITIMNNGGISFSESVSNHQTAKSVYELNTMQEQNQRILNLELENLNEDEKTIYENQNKIKQASYSLLSMEYLLPSVGIIVSDIAIQLNNSVQTTIILEKEIISRNSVLRFLVGSDIHSIGELESNLNANKERISELKDLNSRCGCSSEIQKIFTEQIEIIESEQNRLQEIINSEKSSTGLFGSIFRKL